MKPFNLEEAKAGKPVCTRDGHEARILCFDFKGSYRIVAAVSCGEDKEELFIFALNGRRFDDNTNITEDAYDLMMKGEARKGYVALFKSVENGVLAYCSTNVYETPEKVRESTGTADCMDIVEVNWEE